MNKTKILISALVVTTIVSTTAASVFGVQLYLKNKSPENKTETTQSDPYQGWVTYVDTKRGI